MPDKTLKTCLLIAALVLIAPASAVAEDERWEVGARFNVVTAGGEPANDIISGGVFTRYRLNDKWLLGGAIDQASFDFEKPYEVLGIKPDSSIKAIDADAKSTTFSFWAEREYARPERRLRWFWSGGLGFTSPDADDATGPTAGGGTWNITTDPGTEIILSGAGGLRLPLAKRWVFDFMLRVDHHFADWKVTDTVTSTTASLDDYTGLGGSLALSYRF